MPIVVTEALNSEGKVMKMTFSITHSWKAFSIEGLPSRLSRVEGKALSLGKAIEFWNVSVKEKKQSTNVGVVSARLRVILDALRDAKKQQGATRPSQEF